MNRSKLNSLHWLDCVFHRHLIVFCFAFTSIKSKNCSSLKTLNEHKLLTYNWIMNTSKFNSLLWLDCVFRRLLSVFCFDFSSILVLLNAISFEKKFVSKVYIIIYRKVYKHHTCRINNGFDFGTSLGIPSHKHDYKSVFNTQLKTYQVSTE